MTEILPYPWQTTILQGDSLPELLARYDEAVAHAKEAAQKGVWGVDDAWKCYAAEIAVLVVEKVRPLVHYMALDKGAEGGMTVLAKVGIDKDGRIQVISTQTYPIGE